MDGAMFDAAIAVSASVLEKSARQDAGRLSFHLTRGSIRALYHFTPGFRISSSLASAAPVAAPAGFKM